STLLKASCSARSKAEHGKKPRAGGSPRGASSVYEGILQTRAQVQIVADAIQAQAALIVRMCVALERFRRIVGVAIGPYANGPFFGERQDLLAGQVEEFGRHRNRSTDVAE